jgi:hypothetical protein
MWGCHEGDRGAVMGGPMGGRGNGKEMCMAGGVCRPLCIVEVAGATWALPSWQGCDQGLQAQPVRPGCFEGGHDAAPAVLHSDVGAAEEGRP